MDRSQRESVGNQEDQPYTVVLGASALGSESFTQSTGQGAEGVTRIWSRLNTIEKVALLEASGGLRSATAPLESRPRSEGGRQDVKSPVSTWTSALTDEA